MEIFINGLWGSVCDDWWSWNDANVVCRQLGYTSASAYRKAAWFGQSRHYHIWMAHLACQGTEKRLQDCPFAGWGVHNCKHEQDAGAVCYPTSESFYFNLILLCHQCLQNNNTTLQVSAMKCKQITLNMTFTDLRKCTIPSLHNLLIKLLGVSYVNKACLSKAPFVACLFDITHGLSN